MGSTRIHPGSHSDNKIEPSLRNVPHLNPHGNVMTTTNSRLEVIGVSCTLSVKKNKTKYAEKLPQLGQSTSRDFGTLTVSLALSTLHDGSEPLSQQNTTTLVRL